MMVRMGWKGGRGEWTVPVRRAILQSDSDCEVLYAIRTVD